MNTILLVLIPIVGLFGTMLIPMRFEEKLKITGGIALLITLFILGFTIK